MLIQAVGQGTPTPPGFTTPPWSALAHQWSLIPKAGSSSNPSSSTTESDTATVCLGPSRLVVGHDDSEGDDLLLADDVSKHVFGWDNESPQRTVDVKRFRVTWRPVSNGEFHKFWSGEGKGIVKLPASWRIIDGEVQVSALRPCQIFCVFLSRYGLVPQQKDTAVVSILDPLNVRFCFT